MAILLTVVCSLLAATGIAYLEFRYKMQPTRLDVYDTIRNGIWTTNRRGEGSREALRIHRARIARYTGFGMNRTEAIYWGTSVDSNDEQLDCRNNYRIDGIDPDTRWWCMTVYQDFFSFRIRLFDTPIPRPMSGEIQIIPGPSKSLPKNSPAPGSRSEMPLDHFIWYFAAITREIQ